MQEVAVVERPIEERDSESAMQEVPASNRDAFLFEQHGFDHDPVDFVRRGQVFASFESDDPAPGYLREALGPMGEDVACFSADYGHWDGVVTACVKNVARARDWDGDHLAKLLAGNCLRFYGRRLEAQLAAHGVTRAADAFVLAPEALAAG